MAGPGSVYVAISSDILHQGHLRVLEAAARLGEVTVGLLTDEVVATYKRPPLLDFETRRALLGSLRMVSRVVKQETLSYAGNLRALRPDYVVHGDDWRSGIQASIRAEVVRILAEYGGELVEVPYTQGVSGTSLDAVLRPAVTTTDMRQSSLRQLLRLKPWVRAIETSNGLSARIVEHLRVADEASQSVRQYDAMWLSSLCDSAFKGQPDIELVDFTSREQTIQEIMAVSTKPLIVDGDTGGHLPHFVHLVRALERIGVSAVIVEDKTGLKQNSLFGTDAVQVLEDASLFAAKLNAGKQAQVTRDFMVIARLESLIAGAGVEDALRRAEIYLAAGADGVMIHSRQADGAEIVEFLGQFRRLAPTVPVVLVPTTYNRFTEQELSDLGADIIIHANHLLRSAYPAMHRTAERILRYGRSWEVDEEIMPIKDVLALIPEQG
jgi:phosphoenolpyruvate phosphomutase